MKRNFTRLVVAVVTAGVATVGLAGVASASPFSSHSVPVTVQSNPFTTH